MFEKEFLLITILSVFIVELHAKEFGISKVTSAKISEILILLNGDFIKRVIIAFVITLPIAYSMYMALKSCVKD